MCTVWKTIAIAAGVPFVVALIARYVLQVKLRDWLGAETGARMYRYLPFLALSFVLVVITTAVLVGHCDVEAD